MFQTVLQLSLLKMVVTSMVVESGVVKIAVWLARATMLSSVAAQAAMLF
jgi:hypothetical protein